MKKIILGLLFFCTVFLICATALNADVLAESKKKAAEDNKAVVIYFYSDYCPYCKKMEKDVLTDKEIKKTLQNDVVYKTVNVDNSPETALAYRVMAYPTTILLESNGRKIAAVPGYIDKNNFRKVLAFLKGRHYEKTTLAEFIRNSK